MSSNSGFEQFWIYCTIKHVYFNSKTYDIMKHKLPKREKYLKIWNDSRRNKDGLQFYNLQFKHFVPVTKNSYIRLFAYYYINDQNFHISSIYHDEFKLWKKYEYELNNLQSIVITDFIQILNLSITDNIPIKEYFKVNEGFPITFKLYEQDIISIHSLITFNLAFNIYGNLNVKTLNILDKHRLKTFDMIFNKYYNIILEFYKVESDWKQYLRNQFKMLKGGHNEVNN